MELDLNYRNRNGLWRVGTEYLNRGREHFRKDGEWSGEDMLREGGREGWTMYNGIVKLNKISENGR
jgi:hypothetical protein